MSITIVPSAGERDQYGDPIVDDAQPVEIPDAFVAPRRDDAALVADPARQGVIVGLTLYAPPGTQITRTDKVNVQGQLYEVEGEPGVWTNPFSGQERGVEVALRRAVG